VVLVAESREERGNARLGGSAMVSGGPNQNSSSRDSPCPLNFVGLLKYSRFFKAFNSSYMMYLFSSESFNWQQETFRRYALPLLKSVPSRVAFEIFLGASDHCASRSLGKL
jgi:hypothetical protein